LDWGKKILDSSPNIPLLINATILDNEDKTPIKGNTKFLTEKKKIIQIFLTIPTYNSL
jgi:hypothetical protein